MRMRQSAVARAGARVHQLEGLVFHVDDVRRDATTEIPVEAQRGHRDDHAGGGAHERLADAAGEFVDVADALVADREEHLDHAHDGAEQAEQRPGRGDGAQGVEEALHPVDEVAADILDALADFLARAVADVERGGEQRTERRIAAEGVDVGGVEAATAGPDADFGAEGGRDDDLAPQAPEAFDDDGQRDHRQQQQRDHRPAARFHQFQHAQSSATRVGAGPSPCGR
jgi:hypothetical protein